MNGFVLVCALLFFSHVFSWDCFAGNNVVFASPYYGCTTDNRYPYNGLTLVISGKGRNDLLNGINAYYYFQGPMSLYGTPILTEFANDCTETDTCRYDQFLVGAVSI